MKIFKVFFIVICFQLFFDFKNLLTYPFMGCVLENDQGHKVLILGDFHVGQTSTEQMKSNESNFETLINEYIQDLLKSKKNLFIIEGSDETNDWINIRLDRDSLIEYILNTNHYFSFLNKLTIMHYQRKNMEEALLDEKNRNEIKEKFLNIDELNADLTVCDTRSGPISTIIGYLLCDYKDLISEYYSELNGLLNRERTKAINKILSDELRKEEFVENFCQLALKNCKVTIKELVAQLSKLQYAIFVYQTSSRSKEEKDLWQTFSSMISNVRQCLSEESREFYFFALKNMNIQAISTLLNNDLNNFNLSNYASDLNWSSALVRTLLINEDHSCCDLYKKDSWLNFFLCDIADIGFTNRIIVASHTNTNVILYAGATHCKAVKEYLKALKYNEISEFNWFSKENTIDEENYVIPEQTLNANQLKSLIEAFDS